jgi:hypothetical protein
MFEPQYLQQVKLLLEILPSIDRFPSLALHGGTAINLFTVLYPASRLILTLPGQMPAPEPMISGLLRKTSALYKRFYKKIFRKANCA